MEKVFLMKKLLVLFFVLACFTGKAETKTDSVAMTIAGKQIPVSEFVFIAEKNKEVDLSDSKSLKAYVELFKNFKLKVAEAEELGLDKTDAFKEELEGYRTQLISSYLSDKKAEEAAAREVYDRGSEMLELSHILFRLKGKVVSKDTIDAYEKAMKVYDRINKGEDFDAVGKEINGQDNDNVHYEYVRCLLPLQTLKAFEYAAYGMRTGEVSKPVRTNMGFHLIKIHSRKPNPGKIHVAHILIAFPKDSTINGEADALARAEEVYKKAKNGEDFAELAKQYSDDTASAKKGGDLPVIGPGEMIDPFEKAAYALTIPGQISELVKTRFGYHIIKLIDKPEVLPFDKEKKKMMRVMGQGERNFELFKAFDDRMKKEYGYIFYPEAYAELQALCNDYFPTDPAFYEKAKNMNKTLFHVNNKDFPQSEFAYYIQRCPYSTKIYAGDFMQEVFDLFVRDIVTTAERENLTIKHPEFQHLMQEYRDGILLFEISNREIWSKPAEEQKTLEAEWLKKLNQKYPVSINWKLINNIKK
ncbi:peptidylprolyl isomerase [Parabacteroides bouchesdurhonensis]|uniref:peptidylprolyl isomerase n=1 Tax=Parabacteroides bouchesdurhonensis TaxID=1936995 RepID=UPI000C81B611|nr:peptidylprolyl isomerase [Parabacteroides bouchesdurhonensis]